MLASSTPRHTDTGNQSYDLAGDVQIEPLRSLPLAGDVAAVLQGDVVAAGVGRVLG